MSRYKTIILFACFLLSISVYAQKIVTSEVDEFTGVQKVITSWEYIGYSMGFSPKIRIIKSDNLYMINLKAITHPKTLSVDENNRFLIKFEDGTILELFNSEYTASCVGCGATGFGGSEGHGINLYFRANEQDLFDIEKKTIVKVRLEANQGYFESKTKLKHAEKVRELADLITK